MAINFPDSPSVNDTHTVGDKTWTWDGTAWNVVVGGIPTTIDTLTINQDAEVDGILTANHIHGNIAGSVYLHVKNTSGSEIAAGTPVYATGSVGASGATEVSPSDASTAATMPALGITQSTLAVNGEGHATVLGVLGSQNTGSYNINDSLYVAPGGGLTTTRPTAATDLVQKIARVVRADASTGELLVLGAGRTNDVPNEISILGDLTVDTDTLHVDSTNDRVGIGTASPTSPMHIKADSFDMLALDRTDNANVDQQVILTPTYSGAGNTAFAIKIGSEIMRVTEAGNVGIGTTSPSYKLDVNGDAQVTGRLGIGSGISAELDIKGASNPEIRLQSTDSSDPFLYFGDQVDAVRGGIGYDTSANALLLRGYNNSTRMTIDSAGRVTTPYQPSFRAYLNVSPNPTYGSGWSTMEWNTTDFNVGSHYNTTNYRFTAPVAGKYLFTTSVNFYNIAQGDRFIVEFLKSNAYSYRLTDIDSYNAIGDDRNLGGSIIMNLSANDYVQVRAYGATANWRRSAGYNYGHFAGHFLG